MFCHFVGLCGYVILKVSIRHFVFVFSQTCFLLVASAYLHDWRWGKIGLLHEYGFQIINSTFLFLF